MHLAFVFDGPCDVVNFHYALIIWEYIIIHSLLVFFSFDFVYDKLDSLVAIRPC